MAKKQKVKLLIYNTYIAVIRNSIESKTFRSLYAKIKKRKVDIMRDGKLSCAFFVSSILFLFRLIKEPHATVDSTVKDLLASNWKTMRKPKAGSVLVWEEKDFGNNERHRHIGFYLGDKKAVSNSARLSYPVKHHWTFGGKRKVEMILWNRKLDS